MGHQIGPAKRVGGEGLEQGTQAEENQVIYLGDDAPNDAFNSRRCKVMKIWPRQTLQIPSMKIPSTAKKARARSDSPRHVYDRSSHLAEQGSVSPAHHSNGIHGHCHSSDDTDNLSASMRRIAASWPELPPHIREAILTLVDASQLALLRDRCHARGLYRDDRGSEKLAWRLAKECRSIVQGCLREEEWLDAEREFFAVIQTGLMDQ